MDIQLIELLLLSSFYMNSGEIAKHANDNMMFLIKGVDMYAIESPYFNRTECHALMLFI